MVATTYHQLVSSLSKKHLSYSKRTTFRNPDVVTKHHCRLSHVLHLCSRQSNKISVEFSDFKSAGIFPWGEMNKLWHNKQWSYLHIFILYHINIEIIGDSGRTDTSFKFSYRLFVLISGIRTETFYIIPIKEMTHLCQVNKKHQGQGH